MLSTFSVPSLTHSVRKGTFPYIDKLGLNPCAKIFLSFKMLIEINIDHLKLHVQSKTTFQLLWLFNCVTDVNLIHFSRQNLLFAYKLICIAQPSRPSCNNSNCYKWKTSMHYIVRMHDSLFLLPSLVHKYILDLLITTAFSKTITKMSQ